MCSKLFAQSQLEILLTLPRTSHVLDSQVWHDSGTSRSRGTHSTGALSSTFVSPFPETVDFILRPAPSILQGTWPLEGGCLYSFRFIWKTWHNPSHLCLGLHLELSTVAWVAVLIRPHGVWEKKQFLKGKRGLGRQTVNIHYSLIRKDA